MRLSAEEEAARVKNYERFPGEKVSVNADTVMIGQQEYRLIFNYREGFDAEKLEQRYSGILSKYDYIVGDWGYEQLRLKGYYQNFKKKTSQDKKIETLIDYLYEYCNFGCSFFVLERIGGPKPIKPNKTKSKPKSEKNDSVQNELDNSEVKKRPKKRRKPKRKNENAYIDEKVGKSSNNRKPVIKTRNKEKQEVVREVVKKDKNFTIKKRNKTE